MSRSTGSCWQDPTLGGDASTSPGVTLIYIDPPEGGSMVAVRLPIVVEPRPERGWASQNCSFASAVLFLYRDRVGAALDLCTMA